ncbi:MAG: YebC/PmpR family DNA-binding transcriptional regulator [Planctomycetota bacterium]
MSGHSHWSTIKHKKGAADAKKGKEFSKAVRLLMVAARDGGSDPSKNIKLQYAMDKARSVNMPAENVERAIKKGAGELEGVRLESSMFEGYGPKGVAIMVEVLTDNRNRTTPEIRKIFDGRGGSLGGANSVSWMFERKGLLTIPAAKINEDEIITIALEVGADDASLSGDIFEIICAPDQMENIKKSLAAKGFTPQTSEVTYIPKNYISLDKDSGQKILALMEALEDQEDVQNVYANFDIPE